MSGDGRPPSEVPGAGKPLRQVGSGDAAGRDRVTDTKCISCGGRHEWGRDGAVWIARCRCGVMRVGAPNEQFRALSPGFRTPKAPTPASTPNRTEENE